MKYNHKTGVEAMQFTKENIHEVKAFVECDRTCASPIIVHNAHMGNPMIYIHGHFGTQYVPMGNWIIKDAMGEYHPCSKEHFESMYGAV